jgi:hypothetical protein
MTLFLSKLLPIFVYPLGLAVVLGLISLDLCQARRTGRLSTHPDHSLARLDAGLRKLAAFPTGE